MNYRNDTILELVRTAALGRGIPPDEVERWSGLVRPSALLAPDGDGPVVGRFGGPVMLPVAAEDPGFPLLAGIDCAALPKDATDLPLPTEGHLLLFGWPEAHGWGEVRYVPADAEVAERDNCPPGWPLDDAEYSEVYAQLPEGELHLEADVSLPYVGTVELAGPPWSEPLPGHPRSRELAEVWQDQYIKLLSTMLGTPRAEARLQLGGYGTDCNGADPVELAARTAAEEQPADPAGSDGADWVLLAQGKFSRPGGGAAIFWTVRRDDLIALRFDRAIVLVDWNP